MKADKIDLDLLRHVEEFGWASRSVAPRKDIPDPGPMWTYTVNFEEYCGLPETIIFGLSSKLSHQLLSDLSEKARSGWVWSGKPEAVDELIQDFSAFLRPVHPTQMGEPFALAHRHKRLTAKTPLQKAAQLFWPDKSGKFPWDHPGNQGHWEEQPRLDLAKGGAA
jgi:hypothetical protein